MADDDERPCLYVGATLNPDRVRHFYEVPNNVVELIRPPGDSRTFVEALVDLLGATRGH